MQLEDAAKPESLLTPLVKPAQRRNLSIVEQIRQESNLEVNPLGFARSIHRPAMVKARQTLKNWHLNTLDTTEPSLVNERQFDLRTAQTSRNQPVTPIAVPSQRLSLPLNQRDPPTRQKPPPVGENTPSAVSVI